MLVWELAYGALLRQRHEIVAAGVGLVHMSNKLKLKISTKSVVVSSDPGTSRVLVRKLCALGVKVAVAEHTKDLGVQFVTHVRRRVVVLKKRLLTSVARKRRLRPLVGCARGARRLMMGVALFSWLLGS